MDGSELDHRPVREHLYAPPEHSKLAGRWVDAVDLRRGDTVFLQATGPARIEAVRMEPANYPVYNFSVDGLKCYTVGRNSVLVHNSNGIELPTGQIHHPISKKIADAIDDHPNLSGQYVPRDPRFTTRAIDDAAHRGYQRWHRELDKEVADWIRQPENSNTTAEQFEEWLRWRYSQSDLLARFPNGI